MNEESLFHLALETPPAERAALLERVCANDADLRRRVEALIQAHDNAGSFMDQPALAPTVITPAAESPVDRPPPSLPGDYEIVRELGRGGMGVVYLARQRSLGRDVAVKVLRPGETTFGPMVKRFLDEARHLAHLRHPNIVSIHEIGQAGSEPYFTMDFVAGEPLSARLAGHAGADANEAPRARLSPSQALALLKQAAAGVEHAHAHGIIHRDLKPANILVDASGHAYVTDFGLARDTAQDSKLTRSGEVMGTPAYMAPEQARGQKELIGEATDVHALGDPRIPRDLETICLKAMAKAPDRRYASVRALLEDIRRFESGEPVLARRPGLLFHTRRFVRRHAKLALAVLFTAGVLLALAPRLFDKSVDELIKWANDQQMAGEGSAALKTYARAYRKASNSERRNILEQILACARSMDNPKLVGEAVQDLLAVDPDVSLQEFDYAVADAWGTGKGKDLNKMGPDELRQVAEFGEKRLQLVLGGVHSTQEQKADAEMHLGRIRTMQAMIEAAPDLVGALPIGDPADLLKRAGSADDQTHPVWERGTAAFGAGFILEKSGDKAAALDAYRLAFQLMRPACPVYAGVGQGINMGLPRDKQDQSKEPRLLRALSQAIRRLDPAAPDTLRGGIRFRLVGPLPSPQDWKFLRVSLWDRSLDNPVHSAFGAVGVPGGDLMPGHPGTFPLQLDGTAWVGVADGKYRIAVWHTGSGGIGDGKSTPRKPVELEFRGVPAEVEIRGDTIEVPIRSYDLEEMSQVAPADGASVDLRQAAFRWSPVAKAVEFNLTIGHSIAIPGGTRTDFIFSEPVKGTTFSPADLPAAKRKQFESLKRGHTGTWNVTAYDAEKLKIGESSTRTFKVTHELPEP
ncbi:MAG: serine/threonine protein kinase [Planctomycetia bacterium]|nr:serine/threonine protein kinase [Planctomycetia bacterium]